jgi:hypothetical protein
LTETALVHLFNDMVANVDRGDVGALVLLDMSAAFDTIGHPIMLDVLRQRFEIREAASTGSLPTRRLHTSCRNWCGLLVCLRTSDRSAARVRSWTEVLRCLR